MEADYIHRFITSLIFTVIVETVVLYLFIRFVLKDKETKPGRIIFAGLFASFATIPYVWFVFPYISAWPRNTSFMVSEPFAFLVEAAFYQLYLRLGIGNSLAASLICNVVSYILGPLLRTYGLWFYW